MASIARGSTVFFDAECFDQDDNPAGPGSAMLYISYRNLSFVRAKAEIVMTVNGNVASATWDSSVASEGLVQYSVKAVGATKVVKDGTLTLTSNDANTSQ